MKSIPNIISVIRIISALSILLTEPLSTGFFVLYTICGISDVLDGFIARKTMSSSQFGALLDSMADMIFIGILMIIFLPILDWSYWMLFLLGGIAVIRLFSLLVGSIKYKKACFLHTYANKATGFLIFFWPLLYRLLGFTITVILVCSLAALAALEELCIHIASDKLDRDRKSIFLR